MIDKRGFTLIELLVVVIVIAVLVTIAMPQYVTVVERSKVAKAKSTLAIIASAEKMYNIANQSYKAATTEALLVANLKDYAELGMVTTDTDWTYTVTVSGSTFNAIATRVTADINYKGKTIIIDQAGRPDASADHPLR